MLAGRLRHAQAAVGLEGLRAYLLAESSAIALVPGAPDRLHLRFRQRRAKRGSGACRGTLTPMTRLREDAASVY